MSKRKPNFNSPIAPLPTAQIVDPAEVLQKYLSGEIELICVLGPTASGKTSYAVRLAGQINEIAGQKVAEIISADSRQVYRRMDIGSGKDLAEYGDIPYHLIDIAEPSEEYNVYKFSLDFAECYKDVRRRGAIPILCGGSGLYIQAAAESFFQKDPVTGQMLNGHSLDTFYIGTLVSREERIRRIDARLDSRLSEGMIDEVKSLLDEGVPSDKLIGLGLEYKYVTLYLRNELTYDEMRTVLADSIHRFAKRQMTWFRRLERNGGTIHWIIP